MKKAVKLPVIVFGLICAITAACNSDNTNNKKNIEDTVTTGQAAKRREKEPEILDKDSIVLLLENGHARQHALMKKGRKAVFLFNTGGNEKLNATVQADAPKGNVRIAQLFAPNNNSDGPFGQHVEYDLKERGTYRLVIDENQMAGDPYNGPFTLDINLSSL